MVSLKKDLKITMGNTDMDMDTDMGMDMDTDMEMIKFLN